MSNKVIPLKAGGHIAGIVPQSIEEVFRLSQAVLLSGMAPKDLNTAEKITVAILTGLEVGLPPMFALNKIAIIQGRPTLWGDAIPGLLWSRGFKITEWIETEEASGKTTAHCEVIRPDGTTIKRTFSTDDAKKANLLGKSGPWQQFPARMLAMRARGFAARDGAADILGGLYLREEIEEPMHDITPPRKSSSAAKRDGSFAVFNEIKAEIANAQDAGALHQIREDRMEVWDHLPARWSQLLDDEYDDRMAVLAPATEAAE